MRGIVAKRLRSQDASGRFDPWLVRKLFDHLGAKKFEMLRQRRNLLRSAKRAYSHGSR